MSKSLSEFVDRWRVAALTESSGKQSHFIELCGILGVPTPAQEDAVGERYTFEKRVSKVYGGDGFVDVWRRDHFAWEYKGPRKDLKAAYKQVNDYREDLGNPPLLVVSDFNRFEVHTNFQNTRKRVYKFDLRDMERNQVTDTCPLPPLEVLRALFGDYNVLRPDRTDAKVTQDAAKYFARLAERLEIEHGVDSPIPQATREQIAHFLMRLLFCLFADRIGLLPDKVFRRLIEIDRHYPRRFLKKLPTLFSAMAFPDGVFGEHTIPWFNGKLFEDDAVITLDKADMGTLYEVAHQYDWAHVAPAIFGTLFERSLDPRRRSLIGAHYTSEEDILLLVEPVIMRPLLARWHGVRDSILSLAPTGESKSLLSANPEAERLLAGFFDALAAVRILDPACGSGNFLYVALRRLLDLWKEARDFAIHNHIPLATQYAVAKMPSPSQLFGIEIEFYAHELASIVVWIGFLQWKHVHAIPEDREPILQKLSNIEHADAILRYDADGKPYEPEWPAADFIVGNPPFLGDKKMRRELDDETRAHYTGDLRALYKDRVPGGADLVTFWFEKARAQLEHGRTKRAGLLATNSISMIGNRPVLERIKRSGNIFMAWSDRPWSLDGAAVRVAMVGFDNGSEQEKRLDDELVEEIHADLTSLSNVAGARRLAENEGFCYLGIMKGGSFDMTDEEARKMLSRPLNPNGRPNSDVVKRRLGGQDISGRNRKGWIIDFVDMAELDAALYEMPFEYVRAKVKPKRLRNRDTLMNRSWWLHGRSRPALRAAISQLERCIVTPEVTKHRVFAWMCTDIIPDHKVHVVARSDDYFFGLLQSSFHHEWTIATCSWIGSGNDPCYNSATTFDTFPFPWPPGTEPSEHDSPIVKAIAEAARELVRLRDAWLNPPGASEEDLKTRTLTKLYNLRAEGKCAWLENAHEALTGPCSPLMAGPTRSQRRRSSAVCSPLTTSGRRRRPSLGKR